MVFKYDIKIKKIICCYCSSDCLLVSTTVSLMLGDSYKDAKSNWHPSGFDTPITYVANGDSFS